MKEYIFPYRLSDLKHRITYNDAKKKYLPKLEKLKNTRTHIGQLKLLFSEIFFLTKCSSRGDTVLYVGAACGYHIGYLAKMFPELQFELWDPTEFQVNESDNIKIFNKYFTDVDARKYSGRNVLFICDIRNLNVSNHKDNTIVDSIISNDMRYQARWAKLMNAKYAFLKFRAPFTYGKETSMEYLAGQLYLQIYYSLGMELRLLTNNYDDYVIYDIQCIDELMAYFNFAIRYYTKSVYWEKIMKKYNIFNNYENSMALTITAYYLKMRNNSEPDDETTVKFFLDIIDYHLKKYPRINKIIFD